MPKPSRILILSTSIMLSITEVFAVPNLQEGLWEISSTMQMEGMPFNMPEASYKQCITEQDMVPQKEEPHQSCEVKEYRVTGDTVSWKTRCMASSGDTTSQGTITYQGDSFSGQITTTGSSMPSKMTQSLKGQRIGECVNR